MPRPFRSTARRRAGSRTLLWPMDVWACCYINRGDSERARENFQKAFALLNRVSERERLYITSNYYANCTREMAKAIETLELYRQHLSDGSDARQQSGRREYEQIGQFERAIEGYQESDPARSRSWPSATAICPARSCMVDRFDEAKAICERALALGLDAAIVAFRSCWISRCSRMMRRESPARSSGPVESRQRCFIAAQPLIARRNRRASGAKRRRCAARACELARQHKLTGPSRFLAGAICGGSRRGRACASKCGSERTGGAGPESRCRGVRRPGALALCGETSQAEALAVGIAKTISPPTPSPTPC